MPGYFVVVFCLYGAKLNTAQQRVGKNENMELTVK